MFFICVGVGNLALFDLAVYSDGRVYGFVVGRVGCGSGHNCIRVGVCVYTLLLYVNNL